jgi:internalin A
LALYGLEDASGIANVAGSLEEFRFGPTKKTFSLQFLDAMPALRGLFLAGHKKDLGAAQAAGGIRELGLSMITLPDLRVILPLSELSALSIILGGTRDLALLPKFPKLEKLMLMRITKMSDLGVLAEVAGLKKLHLDWMRNVTTLPSLAPLARLKRVRLDTMKGLTDLAPVAAAPALRELSVTNMPQLKAENFRCLIGHPHLERLWAYVGRQKVNEEIKRLLPAVAQ